MSDSFPKDRIVSGSLCYLFRGDGAAQEVLMLRRSRMPQLGKWSAPGGKMEHSESPDECVIREMREETGLQIIAPQLRAIVTVYDRDYPIHWMLFIYRADQFTGERLSHSEEGELRWIPVTHLDDNAAYPRPFSDRQYWSHVLNVEAEVWRGKFIYDTPATLVDWTHYS